MKLRLPAFVGAALLLAAVAVPAATAAEYPIGGNAVSVGATAIGVGDEVAIAAQTFEVDSDVTFTISSPANSLGTSRGAAALAPAAESGTCQTGSTCVRVADSEGVATALVTFTLAGSHTITATGVDANGEELTVSSTVDVAAADDEEGTDEDPADDQDAPAGGLANTGADILQWSVIGLGLVALGTVIVIALRRRSPGTPA